jgi:hypothetical protein
MPSGPTPKLVHFPLAQVNVAPTSATVDAKEENVGIADKSSTTACTTAASNTTFICQQKCQYFAFAHTVARDYSIHLVSSLRLSAMPRQNWNIHATTLSRTFVLLGHFCTKDICAQGTFVLAKDICAPCSNFTIFALANSNKIMIFE